MTISFIINCSTRNINGKDPKETNGGFKNAGRHSKIIVGFCCKQVRNVKKCVREDRKVGQEYDNNNKIIISL